MRLDKEVMMRMFGIAWFIVLCGLSSPANAAPDYVTAWPKQVPIESPDPVLGDKSYWEHWVYSKAFAKRFRGFPIEKADLELNGGIKAMALRIFKTNLWQDLNPDYPKQYTCEWDIYFDNSLMIPITGKPKGFTPIPYPKGASASYERLDPYEEKDSQAINSSQPVASNPAQPPLVFSVPLDGRFKLYRVREYHRKLVEGLGLLVFSTGAECDVTAPLKEGGTHWLNLLGERPYSRDKDGNYWPLFKAMHGRYLPNIKSTFNAGPYPEAKGYFLVPEAFNKVALPKAEMVKVMNWCIRHRHTNSDWQVNDRTVSWQQMAHRCEEAEYRGRILPDPRYYPGNDGLQDTGY